MIRHFHWELGMGIRDYGLWIGLIQANFPTHQSPFPNTSLT
ncbi:hypothetical protein COO91_04845 [Nostoc flagelliforme CCNUN1]|uniref:Uncharacterized protein n=1 Tax=Nostoc flagelliforme CCNUN1 TaxID=2038116 RepID=A0A2K8SU03_9NOSO|nr:hypothetical protein COO91_04845 [Nostoc flagelliforme CCNUN1]